MRIRAAIDADVDDLVRVDAHARGGDEERISLLRAAVVSDHCLVADDIPVIGYVITTPAHFFGRDFIELLGVVEGRRREGVARRLLRAAVARARTQRIFTSTNESNDAMRALLSADGWSLSGRLDGLDEDDPELVYYIDKR